MGPGRTAICLVTSALALSGCTLFTSIDGRGGDAGGGGDMASNVDLGADGGGVSGDVGTARDLEGSDSGGGDDDSGRGDLGLTDMRSLDAGSDMSSDMMMPDMSADMPGGDLCGDGIVTGAEECEPLGDSSCFDAGFDGGDIVCNPTTCRLDTSACYSCDYYFAAESGDDANTGTSASSPWQSPDRLQALVEGVSGVNAGQRICLRRGEVMRVVSGIDIRRNGIAGQPIYLTEYGDPNTPRAVLTGAISVPAAAWTPQGGGIFSTPFDTAVEWVWLGFDGTNDSATDATLTNGRYHWNGTVLYYSPPAGVLTGAVDVVVARQALDFDTTTSEHVHISRLAFDAIEHPIEISGGANFTTRFVSIIDNEFSRTDDAIRIYAQDGDVSDLEISGNHFSYYRHGIFSSHFADESLRDFTIHGNVFVNATRSDSVAITLRNPANAVITENQLVSPAATSTNVGIELTTSANGKIAQNLIARNYIVGWHDGILVDGPGGGVSVLEGNEISNNVLLKVDDGIQMLGCDVTTGTEISHNTIVDTTSDSIEINLDCGIRVYNNLSVSPGGTHIDQVVRPVGVAAVPNTFDYNMYVPAGRFEAVPDTPTDFTGWQAAGYDANAVTATDAMFSGALLQTPADVIPSSNSAAIDRGTDRGFIEDFGGRPRPVGGAVDIGAWERQPSD